MAIVLLALNVVHAIADSIPAMARAFIDIRQALKETAHVGKKHVRRTVVAGQKKYQKRRSRYERAHGSRR